MDFKEAIQSVADSETITGFTAAMVLKDKKMVSLFVNMISDQYYREGNKGNMEAVYGEEVVKTIINYGIINNLINNKND